ncbi:hypothetical protein CGH87_18185 [Vibrio parahaemolyticus]|uniref:hypothetical protein n=1 Tax=Vibrio TaxID=662 RepID=UPI0004A4DB45|nr:MULTISPECIES: hypothetical protein [Vibrio]HCZ9266945.1 hypothetical protein [Vibrio alginolyticus]EGR3302657.1 hypothetical protein [Vibrio parahaemolyticus]EGR3319720.1 hypothetical protein [Vibrio parahaemolyticus]EHH1059424.1 hypothetical protein [Vibrio parahaemolyticus]KHF06619.1 hypothetical protein PO77_14145 [Vibrio parahaemolyticus]
MSSPITKVQEHKIVELIRNWPVNAKLTWDMICEESESILDYIPTRQALNKKARIKNAYKVRKEIVSRHNESMSSISRPKSINDAVERIMRHQDKIKQLEKESELMAEIINRFIYNASLHGLSEQQLMKPLPIKIKD